MSIYSGFCTRKRERTYNYLMEKALDELVFTVLEFVDPEHNEETKTKHHNNKTLKLTEKFVK